MQRCKRRRYEGKAWLDLTWVTTIIEYATSNGSCCNPSHGYGTRTVIYDFGFAVYWATTPVSNSTFATMNPDCYNKGKITNLIST
jgi:hypothetical protein